LAARAPGIVIVPAGCAAIQTDVSYVETPLAPKHVLGVGRNGRLVTQIDESESGVKLSLVTIESCTSGDANMFRRTKRINRTANKYVLALEYGVGVTGLVGGGAVTYDAGNVPASGDPLQRNPIGRTGAYAVGAGVAVLGIAALVFGLHDSLRARDSQAAAGEIARAIPGSEKEIDCNKRPPASLAIRLIEDGNRTVSLGATRDDGGLLLAWDVVPEEWFRTAAWPAAGKLVTDSGIELALLSLKRPRARVAEKAWAAAQTANTLEAYRDYLATYPEAHNDDARTAYRTIHVPELEAELTASLSSKNLIRAESTIAEWASLSPADNVYLAEGRAKVQTLRTELKLDELLAQADKRLSTASRDHIDDLNEAQAELEQATAIVEPDDARISKRTKRLAQVKAQVIAALVADSRRKAANGDFDGASGSVDAAARLAPDRKEVADARANVERLQKQAADRAERLQKAADEKEQRRIDCLDKCINGKEDFSCSTDNGYGEWMICRAPHCARRCNGK